MSDAKDKEQRPDAGHEHAPTAGPDYDDRGPIDQAQEAAARLAAVQLAHDLHARIIALSVEGDRTIITIASGYKQGVSEGMSGYIPGGGGMLADFTVYDVGERTCKAGVQLTPDQVSQAPSVILNPASRPAPPRHQDLSARIIGFSIQNGLGQIAIGCGRLHGAFVGESGVVLDAGGRRLVSFQLDRVESRVSFATVNLGLDAVSGGSVVLSPSDGSVQGPKASESKAAPGAPAPAAAAS